MPVLAIVAIVSRRRSPAYQLTVPARPTSPERAVFRSTAIVPAATITVMAPIFLRSICNIRGALRLIVLLTERAEVPFLALALEPTDLVHTPTVVLARIRITLIHLIHT